MPVIHQRLPTRGEHYLGPLDFNFCVLGVLFRALINCPEHPRNLEEFSLLLTLEIVGMGNLSKNCIASVLVSVLVFLLALSTIHPIFSLFF